MAFITVYFPQQIIAHINVNWLSPVKVRTTLIGGKDKMLVWNDLEADEKIKIYDKGVDIKNGESVYDLLVSYRSGDISAPKVEQTEALKVELQYFVDCIVNDRTPMNDGAAGLRVVRLLEAAEQSLKGRGRIVQI
jgi:predicted dehydrogenase